MMDVEEKKRKITGIIQQRGPSLPIHVARGTELNTLFASAILSEMVSSRILRVSSLKVGSSPLYYLPGQEEMLDNFFAYLPSKEKDAFLFGIIKKGIYFTEFNYIVMKPRPIGKILSSQKER